MSSYIIINQETHNGCQGLTRIILQKYTSEDTVKSKGDGTQRNYGHGC